MSGRDVVFVGGSMRSGTTVLQAMLCASPDAHPRPRECQYLRDFMWTYTSWRQRADRFITDYFGDLRAFDAFTQRMLNEFLDVARANLSPVRTLVLKNPELTPMFPQLSALLPEAKFVVSIRDPRDTIASILAVDARQRQAGREPLGFAADRDMQRISTRLRGYYAPIVRGISEPRLGLGDRVKFVRYEDLVHATDTVIGELESFTGLSLAGFDRSAAWRDLERPDAANGDANLTPWQTSIHGRGLSDGRVGRYAEVLTAEEVRLIEQHCRDLMMRWRYPIDAAAAPLNSSPP